MLRYPLVCAGLCLATLAGTYVVGCGSDETTTTTDQTGKIPPGPPDGATSAAGPGQAFAVSKLLLGGSDRSGTPNPSAWKKYGYNLDAKVSTAESTDLCQPRAGGSKSAIYPDGNEGIDNAFGKLLWPIIQGLAQDAETSVNDAIADGEFTILFDLTNVSPEPNLVDILGRLYAGQTHDPATDSWTVVPELLSDPMDITSSKVTFPTSYVNNGTWVSGTKGDIGLSLGVSGFELVLNIADAVVTMDLDPSLSGASNGIIAGVIEVEPLIDQLRLIAGSFDESLCGGTTFDSIADQIRQASDMMATGRQDPGATCDAISIGLGFEAVASNLGEVGEPTEPGDDPCNPSMGGMGGTGAQGGQGGSQGGSGGSGGN